ncbi:MAG: hypothetical protein U0L45_03920 [Alistipes sp.]|nr:hypothetical protein [Alistipes sp.]
MKTLNKFFYALLALATVGMVACTETDTYEPGAPEIESCYDVYFPDAATLETQGPTGAVELDPADATEFTYTAYRNNTEGAVTVPVVVTANTQEKFTVSEIVFEEGSDVAEFTVSLNESEIGVPYTLSFAINDPQYVKQYESANANSISLTVTRVKWNDVGVCAYTEDVITSWWGINFSGEWAGQTHPTYNVKVQVRADSIDEDAFKAALEGTGSDAGLSGIYRLVNPYRVGPWANPDDTTLESDPTYLVINAKPYNRAYIDLQPLGLTINGGEASIYSMVGYRLDSDKEPTEDMYGSFNGGTLTFPVQALLGCPGGTYVGSNTYYANADGAFALVVAPALGKYELAMPANGKDGDFAFTAVELPEDALFYSESQSLVAEAVLEEGRPSVSTDDADRNYVAQYGLLYRLPDLYAEGYPIYFGATLDGVVTIHPDFVEQKTGLVQNGYDVYMAIDAKASKFNPETGEVSLVAEFFTIQGEYVIPYGVYNEIISVEEPKFSFTPAVDFKSDFEYTELFTDKLKSKFQDGEWTATLEKGTCTNSAAAAVFAKTYGTAYRIPNAYANGYDIFFAADDKGVVSVPEAYAVQATGTTIYGTPAYIKILKGTMAKTGVTLSVAVCDKDGKAIMPLACTESLVTYNWIDVATGSYYSALNEEPTTGLKFQNAEDTNIYRVYDYLGTGKHMMFTWDSKTNKCEVMGMIDTGVDSAPYGGSGNFFVCDARQFYLWNGKDYSWEILEKNDFVQPYYDPEEKAFLFELFYACPALGVGVGLDFYGEAFVLDGEVAEEKWVDVATGSYASIFSDQQGNQLIIPGVKMQNKENSNSYRLYDWVYSESDVWLNFKWDKETNAVDIVGLNDCGLPASIFGETASTNAHVCDVLTFYNTLAGKNYTWDDITAMYGQSLRPTFDANTNTFSFFVAYVFPEDGILLSDTFFKESYKLDSSAAPASVDAPVFTKISSEKIPVKGTVNIVRSKKINENVRFSSAAAKELVPAKPAKQTPAKRSRINKCAE